MLLPVVWIMLLSSFVADVLGSRVESLAQNQATAAAAHRPVIQAFTSKINGCTGLKSKTVKIFCTHKTEKLSNGIDCSKKVPSGTKATFTCPNNTYMVEKYDTAICGTPTKKKWSNKIVKCRSSVDLMLVCPDVLDYTSTTTTTPSTTVSEETTTVTEETSTDTESSSSVEDTTAMTETSETSATSSAATTVTTTTVSVTATSKAATTAAVTATTTMGTTTSAALTKGPVIVYYVNKTTPSTTTMANISTSPPATATTTKPTTTLITISATTPTTNSTNATTTTSTNATSNTTTNATTTAPTTTTTNATTTTMITASAATLAIIWPIITATPPASATCIYSYVENVGNIKKCTAKTRADAIADCAVGGGSLLLPAGAFRMIYVADFANDDTIYVGATTATDVWVGATSFDGVWKGPGGGLVADAEIKWAGERPITGTLCATMSKAIRALYDLYPEDCNSWKLPYMCWKA